MTPEETNTDAYVQRPKPDPIKMIRAKLSEAEHLKRMYGSNKVLEPIYTERY